MVQPGALTPFGPTTVASGIAAPSSNQPGPATSRLAGGGAVVAWRSGSALLAQQLDAAGSAVGTTQSVGTVAAGRANFSVAALAGGGWIVVWAAGDQTLQSRRYSQSAAPVEDAAPVDGGAFAQISSVQVKGLADGGFVVAWSGQEGGAGQQVFARRFASGGAASGDRMSLATAGNARSDVNILPLSDGSFFAAWVQANGGGTAVNIVTRRLDADLQALAADRPIDASVQTVVFDAAATLLPNGRIALAWTQPGINNADPQVRWQIVDAAGVPLGTPGRALFLPVVDAVEAVPAASGFTVLVASSTAFSRGTNARITALPVGEDGVATSSTVVQERSLASVSATTGATTGPASPGFGAGGGPDGRYVMAYENAIAGGARVEAVAK